MNSLLDASFAVKQIREVVLTEVKGVPVSHKSNVKLLLKAVAPQAELTVLSLEWDRPARKPRTR